MRGLRILLCIGLVITPAIALAGISNGDLPASRWYAHIDLEEMRNAEAGKHLYAWLDREVFDELREESGFDADQEADRITAMSTPDGGLVLSIEGEFTQDSLDKLVAIGASSGELDQFTHSGKTYYFVEDHEGDDHDVSIDGGVYYSVALKNRVIAASSEDQLKSMLDNRGKIDGDYDSGNALVVLTARKSLVQAGINADGIGDDLGWDSNVLNNAKQLALLIADKSGMISIEAQLVAQEEAMANSLASIVRGLISLQVLSDDIDPEVAQFLQSTTVEVDGATLAVEISLEPEDMISVLDD